MAGVKTGAGTRIVVDNRHAVQRNDPSQEIATELFVELRRRFLTWIQANVGKNNAFGLVKLFKTIDERPALNCEAAIVLNDPRISLDQVRGEVEFHADDVARLPPPPQRKILARCGSRNQFVIDGHLRAVRPSRNSQMKSKLRGFGRSDSYVRCAVPRVVRLLVHLQARAVL